MKVFTVTGHLRDLPEAGSVTLRWDEDRGFRDGDFPAEVEVRLLIRQKAEVGATVTGPFFTAAVSPDYVAFLTAIAVFDPTYNISAEGADDIIAVLQSMTIKSDDVTPYTAR